MDTAPERGDPQSGAAGGDTRLAPRALLGLALVALALRGAHLAFAAARSPYWGGFVVDDRAYHEWALAVSRGEGAGDVFFLSPLLSYVLGGLYALAGPRPAVWIGIQALLSTWTVVALALVTARAFGRRAGLVAGLLAAAYGPLLFATESVLSETLHLSLVWSALVVLTSARPGPVRAGAGGLLLGAATLARNAFVPALPLLCLAAWRFRGARAALACAGGMALALLPALAHNLAAGETVLVTAGGGVNLYLGNHPGANGRMSAPPGFEVEAIQDPARMLDAFRARAAQEAATSQPLSAGAVSAHFRRAATEWITGHPGAFLALVGRRLAYVLEAFEYPAERNYAQAARFSPLLRWTPSRWPVALALSVVGLLVLRRRCDLARASIVCVAAAALVVLLGFWVSDRFRLPLVLPVLALAGAGVDHLLGARGRARTVGLVLAAATGALSVALSFGRPAETYMSHYNLGLQYLRAGQAAPAEREARASLELAPEYVPALGLLVEALRGQGPARASEAQQATRELVRRAREKGIPLRVERGGER